MSVSRHTAATMRSISETLLYHNKQLIPPFEHDLHVYKFTVGIGRECHIFFFGRAPTSWKKKTGVLLKNLILFLFINQEMQNLLLSYL